MMKTILSLVIFSLLTSCAPAKLPPLEIRESKWCETEPCDAMLVIVDVAVDRGGRIVNGGYVDRLYMPMRVCQNEVLYEPLNYSGPISVRGYRRSNNAWCEYREGYDDR